MQALTHNLKRMKYLEQQEKTRKRLKPEEMLFQVRIEDINKTNYKFEKLKIAEMNCVSLSACGFCSGVLSSVQFKSDPDSLTNTTIHLIICSVTTLILLFAIYWRTVRHLKWEQSRMIYSNVDNLISTKKYILMIIEFIINLVHPTYGMQNVYIKSTSNSLDIELSYDLISLINCFMMIRIYHAVRYLFVMSKYKASRFQRLCKIYGTSPNNWFTFKCMMKENPVFILTCMFAGGLFLGAYALYVFESPVMSTSTQKTFKDFSRFGNAIWCVIATMATVGYGDYYPVTTFGRLAVIIVAIWGVLTMSLTAATFSNLLTLNLGESTSLQVLRRIWYKDELRKSAAFVLSSAVRLRLMMIHKKPNSQIKQQFMKFRYYLKCFQIFKGKKKLLYDFDSYSDRIEIKLLNFISICEEANDYLAKSNEVIEHLFRLKSHKRH